MARQVEQRVHLGDRHLLGSRGELDDPVSRLHLALFEHAEVEPRTAVGDEESGNPRVVHADPDAVTGHARLGHLEARAADPVTVTDAHLLVGEPFDGEVLAELPVREVVPSQLVLPMSVGVDLVDEHRSLLTAVPRQIALTVALDVEPGDAAAAGDRVLEHAGEDGPPLPRDVLRHADVDRQQPPHRLGSGRRRVGGLRLWAGAHLATVAPPGPAVSRRPTRPVIRTADAILSAASFDQPR